MTLTLAFLIIPHFKPNRRVDSEHLRLPRPGAQGHAFWAGKLARHIRCTATAMHAGVSAPVSMATSGVVSLIPDQQLVVYRGAALVAIRRLVPVE